MAALDDLTTPAALETFHQAASAIVCARMCTKYEVIYKYNGVSQRSRVGSVVVYGVKVKKACPYALAQCCGICAAAALRQVRADANFILLLLLDTCAQLYTKCVLRDTPDAGRTDLVRSAITVA